MTKWSPIVSTADQTGRRAFEAASAILVAVSEQDYPPPIANRRLHRRFEEPLLYAYWGLGQDEPLWTERAIEILNASIEDAATVSGYLGLHGGLCGLGWVVEHLSRLLAETSSSKEPSGTSDSTEIDCDEGDPNGEIDAVVSRTIRKLNWSRGYDLIGGLVGYGVYFLERLPARAAVEGIHRIIDHLDSLAEHTSQGVSWHTRPGILPDWQRTLCPSGYYNLGVAHGIPGIMHFLGESLAAGIGAERCQRLLEGSFQWLMAHQRPPGSLSRFDSWVTPERSSDSRLAWCYGDLGLMAVLLQVARRSGRSDWHEFAHSLLDHCLAWPVERSGILDAGLCHGAVGVAHIFNRIYQADGDPRCLEASLAWYERALAMRLPGTGVGGFLSFTRPDAAGPVVWEPSPAFLDGAIGVALGLLAALTPVPPGWDRMLQLSGSDRKRSSPIDPFCDPRNHGHPPQ